MASRPAPRRSTEDERAFLAQVRARNKTLNMTDVYNYERTKNEQFNQGLSNARSLEGLTTPTPQRVEFDISKARALEGLTNKSSEGTGIANIVGRPGYVGSMYKMGDAYYSAGEGSLTNSLNSIASFVKDNPRLSAESTALGAAGSFARILGQGESFADFVAKEGNPGGRGIRRGTVESMRGELEAPATTSTYVDAGSYFTPGAALKGLGVVAKGTAKAARLGGGAASMAAGSRPVRIGTGLAGGVGAYAGYNEINPTEAEAVSIPNFTKLLTEGLKAEASRPGRNLANKTARQIFDTMRNRGGGKGRIPTADMKVKPNKEYVIQMVEENRGWFNKNKEALDIYPAGKQEGHAVSAAHPPGMDPSLASSTIPDHFTGGKLNEIEKIINAERRRLELPALTNYKDIIEAAINKANNAGFGSNTYAATLKGKSLDEAKTILGAVDVKYYE